MSDAAKAERARRMERWAESFGLLHEVHVTEPCGESCRCVEWDDFPQECLRETDEVSALRAVLASAVERSERMAECRTWFYYGWQACERSKKP